LQAACSTLGVMYAGGHGVARDDEHAAALFASACAAEQWTACTNLAACYSTGRGVPRDARRATELLSRACTGGDPSACAELHPPTPR
jgi:TPR repeat protein